LITTDPASLLLLFLRLVFVQPFLQLEHEADEARSVGEDLEHFGRVFQEELVIVVFAQARQLGFELIDKLPDIFRGNLVLFGGLG